MKTLDYNLSRIAAFVAVAEAGTFTAAAEHMASSKSALSQAISQLERELGVQLLQRSTRKLTITEAGIAFLNDSRALLKQAEQVVERARSGRAQPAGTLRLTSALDSAGLVADWIARYRERYPEMHIEYQPTDQKMDLIEGRFDLALRIGRMLDTQLHAVKLADLELYLVAAETYLARRGLPHIPADLANHEWLSLSVIPTPWTATFHNNEGHATTVRLKGSISVSAATALRSLALAGAGIASMPESMVEADLNAGRLTRILPGYRQPPLYLYAVYPGTVAPPAKTRAFIDLVKENRLKAMKKS
ncbi:MAG: LysR family transcriptional regulator [Betaproteobacteria bacterium]|nr:LysR family transcriptional regulator [Betaproteobacteria bacterium]